MALRERLKAAWNALRGFTAVEATATELYGKAVDWWEIFSFRGMPLFRNIFGPEARPDRNATIRLMQDHDRVRNTSRVLAESNANAAGLIERMIDYAVGRGSSTEVHSVEEGEQPPKRLAKRLRAFIRTFKDANDWLSVEEEMVSRKLEDGEWFLRFYPQEDGTTQVRFIEPSSIRPPSGEDADGEWSFGIYTPYNENGAMDATRPVAYNVHNFRTGEDEKVEAQFIIHAKFGVKKNRKRGIPWLYAVEGELRGAERLRYATREGEKIRQAIAYFRQHDYATEQQVRDWQSRAAPEILTRQAETGSMVEQAVQPAAPGEVVDIPAGLKPVPPPSSPNSSASSEAVKQALEATAARFGVPIWMVSGANDTASFANSLTAESPMAKSLERAQAQMAGYVDAAQTKAVEIGIEQGLLPEETLETVDLLVSFPNQATRNKKDETDRRSILYKEGIISKTQWTIEEGYDPEEQQRQRTEEAAPPPDILPMNPDRSQTPAAQYARLTAHESFDEGKIKRAADGKFGSGPGTPKTREERTAGRQAGKEAASKAAAAVSGPQAAAAQLEADKKLRTLDAAPAEQHAALIDSAVSAYTSPSKEAAKTFATLPGGEKHAAKMEKSLAKVDAKVSKRKEALKGASEKLGEKQKAAAEHRAAAPVEPVEPADPGEAASPEDKDAYQKAYDKYTDDHERWESASEKHEAKQDRLDEAVEAAGEKVSTHAEAIAEALDEHAAEADEIARDAEADIHDAADDDEEADVEPDEPELPDDEDQAA